MQRKLLLAITPEMKEGNIADVVTVTLRLQQYRSANKHGHVTTRLVTKTKQTNKLWDLRETFAIVVIMETCLMAVKTKIFMKFAPQKRSYFYEFPTRSVSFWCTYCLLSNTFSQDRLGANRSASSFLNSGHVDAFLP